MRRREFIVGLGTAAAWPLAAHGQRRGDRRLIGVLMGLSNDAEGLSRATLLEETLRGLGWTSGDNVRIEYRWAAGDRNLIRSYAAELVALKPDVILGDSTPVVIALRQETQTIPIVFVQVSDPLGSGLVSSLARPGGNVTGFTNFEFSMGGKWVEILREINPSVKRVAVIFNSQTAPYGIQYVRAVEQAALPLNIVVEAASVTDPNGIQNSVEGLSSTNESIIVLPDIFTGTHHKFIVSRIAQRGLQAVYPFPYFVTSGGLLSYGIDQLDLFRRSASYIDRILRGENPAELPVQQPIKFRLVVNLKTANSQAITIPPTLLARADEVIE